MDAYGVSTATRWNIEDGSLFFNTWWEIPETQSKLVPISRLVQTNNEIIWRGKRCTGICNNGPVSQ